MSRIGALTLSQIQEIAQILLGDNFRNSEAYPISRWKKEGWPEDRESFKIIDSYLDFLWKFKKYESSGK